MVETSRVNAETRMLIAGELVEAESGRTFANVNPATEEVIGYVADGSSEDMRRAIAAARRAFDETDWSTNRAFRKRCLEQLQGALEAERDELREELILEVSCPRMLTYGPQLEAPLAGALRHPAKLIDEFAWETELSDATDLRGNLNSRRVRKEPVGVVGAIVPVPGSALRVVLRARLQARPAGDYVETPAAQVIAPSGGEAIEVCLPEARRVERADEVERYEIHVRIVLTEKRAKLLGDERELSLGCPDVEVIPLIADEQAAPEEIR